MKKIQKTNEIVEQVLRNVPEARNGDFELIYHTYIAMGYLPTNKAFKTVIMEGSKLGYTPFESITRAKRKIVKKYPELDNKATKKYRNKQEEKYREYYGSEK